MQNNRVSKKVVVPDFEKVDKRKKNVGQHDSDSDFEDEIFVPKMKKSKKESRENARVTRSKVSVGIGKVDDNKSDKKKSRNVCKVRRDMSLFQKKVFKEMIEYHKKVESEFNGMREFVQESVKLILNELRLVKQQSSEFVEKENVDVGLQTPNATNKQDEVFVDPVIEKYSFGDDVSVRLDGVIHSKNVLDHVRSLSTMIPIFLVATNFYGKRSNIDRHRKAAYIDKSLSELLEYVILKDTPQQEPQSNDCGMYVCAFAEYVSHGIFDISSRPFDAVNHRIRYGALL
ncbi:hypothetical protein BC332_22990 [Capsicum chinense]|nr:hypothetical protein BC332_22990 [Capsicum chinense]